MMPARRRRSRASAGERPVSQPIRMFASDCPARCRATATARGDHRAGRGDAPVVVSARSAVNIPRVAIGGWLVTLCRSYGRQRMRQVKVGDITIDAVIEREGPWRRPQDFFPSYNEAVF